MILASIPNDAADAIEKLGKLPLEKLGVIAVLLVVVMIIMSVLLWRQYKLTDRIMETVDKLISALERRRNGK